MKNLSLLSLLCFASTPLMAMEGQWKQEEQKPADQQKKNQVPTLEELCLKSFSKATDAQLLKTFAYNSHPEMGAELWARYPQDVIDRDCFELLDELVKADYPVEVKVAMAKRLSKEKAQKLFDDVLDITNNMPDKVEFAFALFEEIFALQTWQNAQAVAQLGPITVSVAKIVIYTTRYIWMELIEQNGEDYFPKDMLNHENHKAFEQAALEELEKNKFYGKFLEEGPTLKELCALTLFSNVIDLQSSVKAEYPECTKADINSKLNSELELAKLKRIPERFGYVDPEELLNQQQIALDIDTKTEEEVIVIIKNETALFKNFEEAVYFYRYMPIRSRFPYPTHFEKMMNLILTFLEEAQKRGYEFPRKDKGEQ